MFKTTNTVRMYDTDAAGILYFGSQFRFAHDAFEALLAEEGFTFQHLFEKSPFIFVIVHAESDYKHSLHVGDQLEVETEVSHIGTTSFTLSYSFYKKTENEPILAGTAKTIHVCIDKITRKKRLLAPEYVNALAKYQAS